MWQIPLFDLDYGPEEEQAVLDVLRSRWLTMGEVTQRFEGAFAEQLGVQHAVAVSNGTTALHLACAAAGLGAGDEVILPALTFVASAAAVRYTGARPVFADCTSLSDLCLSPDHVEALITPRTRAVMVMHYGGYMCDMPAFEGLARRNGLLLLEDACHAPAAALDGRPAGGWGFAAGFSFFSNKNLATGEGGMLTTSDAAAAEQVRRLRSHGMTSLSWDRYKGQALSYDVTALGYNYRPTEITSALGLVQLGKLRANNARRRALSALYHQLLAELTPQVGVPFTQPRGTPSAHLLAVILPPGCERAALMTAMKAQGIQTSIHYPLIPSFSAYRAASPPPGALPVAEQAAQRQLTLPLYAGMREDQVHTVVQALRDALQQAGAG